MNGMLSRTSGNSLPPAQQQLKHQILQSKTSPVQAQKRHCKSSVWQRSRSGGGEIEPTSVLDIRSPSPTSTLSSSLGGSSESAGAVAAVSGGLLCEAVSDGGGGSGSGGGAETLLVDSSGKEAFNNGGGGGSGSSNSPARWYPNRGGGNGREGFGWRLNNGEQQQPGGGGMLEGKSEVKKEEPQQQQQQQQQQQSRVEEWGSGGGGGPAGVMEDLESMLFESGAGAPDQSLMRWLLGEIEDPKDLPPPQIKAAATSGGSASASAAHFEDPSIEPNFTDPAAAFGFSSNNISDVIAPPQVAPPPSSFRAPYTTLPNQPQPQQQFIPAPPPPPPPPPPPFAYHAPIPTPFVPNAYHPEILFSAPAVYGSNPAQHFGPDFPRFNLASDPNRNNNNLLFDMPLPPAPKRFGLEHQLWQQTFKQQEYMNMMKPQNQQELLQSLQRRQQFLHQPPPPPPHHHQQLRQKAIVNNTFKVGGSGAAAEEVQVIVEQLLKAAEAVELGNLDHAQAILARLNQHLSPLGKPLHRAAFYFKEALASRILNTTGGDNRNATGTGGTGTSNIPSPLDMVYKISAYKSFSESSPLAQFAHFTANQALLEALDGAEAIHIIDFEIGLGGQWASFLQELAVKLGGAPPVRLTALGSSASSSLELQLTRDNLCNFAKQLNVPFEFELLHLDRIDLLRPREREAVAVNLSLLPSTFTSHDSISRLLRFIKNLAPRAVVVVDAETTTAAAAAASAATTSAASFVHHFLEALQFYSFLFDSLDAVNINMDAVHKIEKFLLAPKIDATISSAATPPWKTLFAAAGFSPVAFSNFTETQAEYLIQRLHGRGFEVLKAHTALLLGWQGRPLVSATAWRCGSPP